MKSIVFAIPSQTRKHDSGEKFRKLPPPPDKRRVQFSGGSNVSSRLGPDVQNTDDSSDDELSPPCPAEVQQLMNLEQIEQESLDSGIAPIYAGYNSLVNLQPLGQISPTNTTLICDKYGSCFKNPDSKWLVQCFPRAVTQTITNRVVSGEITVARRYIFVMIGGNQVFRASKTGVARELRMLVECITGKNNVAKIFIVGVLPCPGKPHAVYYIKQFNRYLAAATKKLQKQFTRTFYILAQLQFIAKREHPYLFTSDSLMLNEFGRMRLKRVMMEGAGFITSS